MFIRQKNTRSMLWILLSLLRRVNYTLLTARP